MLKIANSTPRRSRGRPRREDVAGIEEVLLNAALAEFVAHGYGGASLARIVRSAGVSKTTLWSRYADKAALFRAIVLHQMDKAAGEAILTPRGRPDDLERGLVAYGNSMLTSSLEGEMGAVNRLIAYEAARFPELGYAAVERTMAGQSQVATFIRACTAADPQPPRDPESVAGLFIAALRGWHATEAIACVTAPRRRREAYVKRTVELLLAARDSW